VKIDDTTLIVALRFYIVSCKQLSMGDTKMKLQEIRDRAVAARQLFKKINPPISCYMVVMINRIQFMPPELEQGMGNYMDLAGHSDLFLPSKDLQLITQTREEMLALMKEIESIEKAMKKIKSRISGKIWAHFDPLIIDAHKQQNSEELEKIFTESEETLELEMKKATAKSVKKSEKFDNKLQSLYKTLKNNIETTEFHEPQIELRFYELDMEKIQQLKAHPLVQAVGKTDMSPASITVVVG
jgi:hypothetical protein